ncbi:putative Ig domain-containing protein [Streptacidiphilus sp. EB129]|uniref:putative Ig domain-containing protein n=1 Tax=Streptacidiphilus sp. EB129 TaxID=3156262 RepID=UPI003519AB3D
MALAAPASAIAPAGSQGPRAPHATSPTLTQVSSDPYSDSQAQHATEVEPDTYSYGSTVVSAFQVGRVSSGGASNIGWATTTDGGQTWTHGFMPATTANTGGPYVTTSDASVAYDAKDGVWMVSWLGITAGSDVDVELSRSTDGGHTWGNPVTVSTGTFDDKNWSVCDDHPSSPSYGHCYTEYDDANAGDAEHMRTSTDGGATWGAEQSPADSPSGLGGQPVVQPNGTVVVPFSSASSNAERSFTSTNGGASWTSSVQIATISHHPVAGLEAADMAKLPPRDSLRESPLPSAEIDASGKVFAVWSDCRFRSGCTSNDIIMSTSTNGTSWSTPVRVPIDAATSTADHFTPGIGVDPSSSGSTTRIGLTYYYYPNASCTDTTCQLDAGYVSSADSGTTWTAAVQLAGPMTLAWLPNTSQGRMFGDYISTSVLAGGNAVTVIPVAHAPSGSTFDMAMYAPTGGLPVGQSSGGNTVTVTNPGNQTSTVGTAASLQISATDSGGAGLTYSATGLPAGLSISTSGLISGTPTTTGTSTVTVTATDSTGASGSTSFTWTVNSQSTETVSVANPGNQTSTVGTAASLQISATDSAGKSLTYSATGLPAGLSISSTGLISGTPTSAATSSVTVTASSGTASGSTSFSWTVNGSTGGCTSPGQKIGNPGFETGSAAPWTMTAGVLNSDTVSEPAHSGNWDAWLDGYGASHTDTMSQAVAVPAGCNASFSFWLHVDTNKTNTTAIDTLKVQVISGSTTTTLATYSNLNAGNGYNQYSFNLNSFAGQNVTLKFTGVEKSGAQTSFVVDDTALNAS